MAHRHDSRLTIPWPSPGYLDVFPALVEAWEPFLPKPLRGAGPEAFAAASGYDGALHAKRIAWLLDKGSRLRRRAA